MSARACAGVPRCSTMQYTATQCKISTETAGMTKVDTRLCLHVWSTLQHTVTHCNTLQHNAAHSSTLQNIATSVPRPQGWQRSSMPARACAGAARYAATMPCSYCSVLQCVAVCCRVLYCVAMWSSVLQCAVCRGACGHCALFMLQCVAVCCSVLQCVAVIDDAEYPKKTRSSLSAIWNTSAPND